MPQAMPQHVALIILPLASRTTPSAKPLRKAVFDSQLAEWMLLPGGGIGVQFSGTLGS